MPETIDWPPPSRRPRTLLYLLGALVLLYLLTGRLLSFYVNGLWYGSLGYRAVFLKTIALRWGVFAVFFGLTFAALYLAFLALRRLHGAELPSRRAIVVNGQKVNLHLEPLLRPVALLVSLLVAVFTALSMAEDWPTLARFLYAPRIGTGPADPIFGRPLEFYLLRLPALETLSDWLITLAVLILGLAFLLRVLTARSEPDIVSGSVRYLPPARWRGVSFAFAWLLLVVSLRVFLSRYDLLLGENTIFSGITFTDAHIQLPGLVLTCLALLAGAAIALWGGLKNSSAASLVLAVAPAIVCYLGTQALAAGVDAFIVKPNQLNKETPYIRHNIDFTRQAFALDRITPQPFAAQTSAASLDPADNQPTLQNIRLWDWRALQDTLRQVQEIRTYYDFPDIDIDRYTLNGQTREVMLAARELNVDKLPESSQNWINDRLIYTHGYGLTMNPVNGFTPEGLPQLMLSNMPVQSTVPGLQVKRPEIYYGELTDTDVYVRTRQKEFNYPQGQANSMTSYEGTGGIPLGSWFRRVLIALERNDLAKLPFSDDVEPDSLLLMRRNIRERVATLAPFLHFDNDPYIVVRADGHLSWIIDAYTTSDSYPYARHSALGDDEINYLRNSVKVVVDAYTGATTFYVFDTQDPVLGAYRNIFPSLFRDAAAMPADLRAHIRYPDLMLRIQAEAYGLYHMTDPEVFYNREDLWTPATESGVDQNGDNTTLEMPPNFVLMKLPGEHNVEFVNILPFTPANRNNLIGWIAGRSDGAHYGSAVVYNFPKSKLVDGPLQVEARIDQNAEISGQLTLWNQQGSHVRRGNLLVIPTGDALLYAEAIYLQAERSPMPELRLVVLAVQDRLAYGPTFEAALNSLFNNVPSSLSAPAPTTANSAFANATLAQPAPGLGAAPGAGNPAGAAPIAGAASVQPTSREALIHEAAADFDAYQRLTAQGQLGAAGQKLEALKTALSALSATTAH